MSTLLKLAAFVAATWMACLGATVMAADVLVTEVRGVVTGKGTKPVQVLDVVRTGDRLRVAAGAKVSLFVAEGALLYTVDGPAEIANAASGLSAKSGKLPAPEKLNNVYSKLRVDDPSLAQATLVMRNASATARVRVESPEGIVAPADARRFAWRMPPGKLRFELASDDGRPVYAVDVEGLDFVLPETVKLVPGVKYVWGLSDSRAVTPLDWTEFVIDPQAPIPPAAKSPESLVHIAWLHSRELPRAAARMFEAASR